VRAELESEGIHKEKARAELDAREIKRKPLVNERAMTPNGRSELESGNETKRQYGEGAHDPVKIATEVTTQNKLQAAHTIHESIDAPPQPAAQSSRVVDDELLWLEQEEARMKESQARFRERKEQLLAQKAGGSG